MAATADKKSTSFDVNLKDGVSGPAVDAARALVSLKESMDNDTAALREMQKAMRTLQSAAHVDIDTYRTLKQTIDNKSASVVAAQAQYIKLGGTFEKIKRQVPPKLPEPPKVPDPPPVNKYQQLAEVAKGMPGPLGRVIGLFEKFSKLVGGRLIAAGLIAIAAGLVAVTVATGKAITNLYSYAVAQGNARRSELLRLEGLGKMWGTLGAYMRLASDKATDLQAGIDRVSASSALSRDQVARYGVQLQTMGLRGKAWESALEGMSMKAAVQGDAQAQMFAAWAQGLALTGGSVERLTEKVRRQIGGIAKAQMLDADVQSQKLGENFSRMFATVKIEGLLKAKASLYSMLDQSTASGKALAGILGRLVQPMVDAMSRALPVVKAFFQDMIIWELGLEIAYQRLRVAFLKAFKKGEWKKLLDECTGPVTIAIGALATAALVYGIPALWSLAGAAAGAAMSLAGLVVEAALVAAPFLLAGAAIWGAFQIVKQLWDLFSEDIDFGLLWKQFKADVSSIKWGDIGRAIMQGIADAIIPRPVMDALNSVAKTVVGGFKRLLGIASPSKVFAALGEQIPAGLVEGIDRGDPKVKQSMSGMASVPTSSVVPQARPLGAAAGGGAQRGGSVTIQELHVHSAAADAKGIVQDLRRELEALLTELALTMGAV